MSSMIKKYVPYAVIIVATYMLLPLFFVFTGKTFQAYTPVLYDIVFPIVAILCSIVYAKKYGVDFFFSLVAPIIYIPSMIIYNGINANNIIFVAIYLVSSILGLFLGDMFFGSKTKQDEPSLDVDLDIEEDYPQSEPITKVAAKKQDSKPQKTPSSDDDFFENYSSSDNYPKSVKAEDEIDKILNEIHKKD